MKEEQDEEERKQKDKELKSSEDSKDDEDEEDLEEEDNTLPDNIEVSIDSMHLNAFTCSTDKTHEELMYDVHVYSDIC